MLRCKVIDYIDEARSSQLKQAEVEMEVEMEVEVEVEGKVSRFRLTLSFSPLWPQLPELLICQCCGVNGGAQFNRSLPFPPAPTPLIACKFGPLTSLASYRAVESENKPKTGARTCLSSDWRKTTTDHQCSG